MELGSALDAGLNEYLMPALAGRPLDLDRGVETLWGRVGMIPDDLADEATRKLEGAALEVALRAFAERHPDWHGQDVQQRFEVEYRGVKIVGVIDRVDASGEIVDHKLTRSQRRKGQVLDPEWLGERRPQLALYLACAALAEGQPVGTRTKAALEVCYASARLATPQWTYEAMEIPSAEQQAALEDAVTASVIAASGVYPAHPGRHCGWCEHTVACQQVMSMMALDISAVSKALEDEG
jgi:RecB family exonuclease